jgi:ribosomal protein L7/L12
MAFIEDARLRPGTSAICRWTAADAWFNSHNHKEQLMPTQIPAEILKHWQNGHKIEAIKQLREQSGLGLKEAKTCWKPATSRTLSSMAQQSRRRPCSSCASSWKNWA